MEITALFNVYNNDIFISKRNYFSRYIMLIFLTIVRNNKIYYFQPQLIKWKIYKTHILPNLKMRRPTTISIFNFSIADNISYLNYFNHNFILADNDVVKIYHREGY